MGDSAVLHSAYAALTAAQFVLATIIVVVLGFAAMWVVAVFVEAFRYHREESARKAKLLRGGRP
jgi:uncharacterized membrane protein YuzA (DUF378 family)